MTPDPYVTVQDWLGQIDLDGHADTCADEAYGDQWDRMDAYLAEDAPWPATPIQWDTSPEWAKVMAEIGPYNGRYKGQWGALMMGSRGPQAERLIERKMTERLLDAIFGGAT